ncbi:DUF3263 domain-containing protein [Streptomyces sp. JV176]|uniref:DUF3263 domain-containing protein n=1 Tax=Streptomyces sp. JV176 TaxID=858630 RepID=UPI002E783CA9|nr:DUF3263 domain-containing protein [Streptomyces sp. JV176]MEE1800497.1 DUF3263 domain-containing protein [Streptomyces sp. JV176]
MTSPDPDPDPDPAAEPDPEPAADPAPEPRPAPALSGRDRAVLAMEGRGWPGPGAKEREIRERLGLSPTRYYQLLNALLDDPRAAEHDPVTVNRLRRVRAARRDLR